MTLKLEAAELKGKVIVPPSKSMAHRAVICAALAEMMTGEKSRITGLSASEDIKATCEAMGNLESGNEIFCNESGSTLRFVIPIAVAIGGKYNFTGSGKLCERPIDAYIDIFNEQGIYNQLTEGKLPYIIEGKLKSGVFRLRGDVSSQYISGLLFALPLLEGDSVIEVTTPLESKSYVDLTIEVLKVFGIEIDSENYQEYRIKGKQTYKAAEFKVEGDYSQAAFWEAANVLGMELDIAGLNQDSKQGDKEILRIASDLTSSITTEEYVIDVSQIPDLVPIITVMSAMVNRTVKITNAARLRIKECDRLAAITEVVNSLGGNVTELEDGLIIEGKEEWLKGGATVSSYNDHRIAMSVAIAALRCKEPVSLNGAESVNKSYPDFWDVYRGLGGIAGDIVGGIEGGIIDEFNMG